MIQRFYEIKTLNCKGRVKLKKKGERREEALTVVSRWRRLVVACCRPTAGRLVLYVRKMEEGGRKQRGIKEEEKKF